VEARGVAAVFVWFGFFAIDECNARQANHIAGFQCVLMYTLAINAGSTA
jgi:hypothetical protein